MNFPQVSDCLPCGGFGIGFGQEFAGNPALVTGGKESLQNGFEIQVPCAGIPAVGIGHVEVEDARTARADAVFDIRLFDVHVEGVQQQAEVIRADPLDQLQPLGSSVDQRRLVAVDRFQRQADPMRWAPALHSRKASTSQSIACPGPRPV